MQRHQFDPWPWKMPHAMGQLSPSTKLLSLFSRARELHLLKPRAGAQPEKPKTDTLGFVHRQQVVQG